MLTSESQYSHTRTLLLIPFLLLTLYSFEAPCKAQEVECTADGTVCINWSSLLNTGTPRLEHTATTLLDGRILFVGGDCPGSCNADDNEDSEPENESCSIPLPEVFEPTTGRWFELEVDCPTGHDETNERRLHTATLLEDGRVLVMGGRPLSGAGSSLRSCSVYNTTDLNEDAEIFIDLCAMSPRAWHTAVRFENGVESADGANIALIGGSGSNNSDAITNGETCIVENQSVDCQSTDDWPLPMETTRIEHSAARLIDGRLWIFGERTGSESEPLLFDITTSTPWQSVNSSGLNRYGHSTTLLRSNVLMNIGGRNGILQAGTVDAWSVESQEVIATQDLEHLVAEPATVLMPDDSIVFFGGGPILPPMAPTLTTEVQRCRWTSVAVSPIQCEHLTTIEGFPFGLTATLLPGSRILVVGATAATGARADAEPFAAIFSIWDEAQSPPTNSMETPRSGHSATMLADGSLLIVGSGSSEIYSEDAVGGGWSDLQNLPGSSDNQIPHRLHRATLLEDGRVFVTGGETESGAATSSSFVFSQADEWSEAPPMACNRKHHSASRLWDGRVLVLGGEGECEDSALLSSQSYELFDPQTMSWSAVKPIPLGESSEILWMRHAAVLLPDSRILLAGGYADSASATEEGSNLIGFIDPSLSIDSETAWTLSDSKLQHPASNFKATLLMDGSVFLSGTSTTDLEGSVEIIRLNGERATQVTSLPDPPTEAARLNLEVLSLLDGRALIVGGSDSAGNAGVKSNHTFDPNLQTPWSETTPSQVARQLHTANLLPSGSVLISGGLDHGTAVRDSEVIRVGLGHLESARPQVESLIPLDLDATCDLQNIGNCSNTIEPWTWGQRLLIRGDGLVGLVEGSGGNGAKNSPSDAPLVQLRSLNNNQIQNMSLLGFQTYSDSQDAIIVKALDPFPIGPAMLTVTVNGVSSIAQPIHIASVELDAASEVPSLVLSTIPAESRTYTSVEHAFTISNVGRVDATDVEFCLDIELVIEEGSNPVPIQPSLQVPAHGSASLTNLREGVTCNDESISNHFAAVWELGQFSVGETIPLIVTYSLDGLTSSDVEGLLEVRTSPGFSRSLQPQRYLRVPSALRTPVFTEREADLQATISDARTSVEPGDPLAVYFTLENHGPGAAFDVEVVSLSIGGQSSPGRLDCFCTPDCDGETLELLQIEVFLPGSVYSCRTDSSVPDMNPPPEIEHEIKLSIGSPLPGGWTDPDNINNEGRDETPIRAPLEPPIYQEEILDDADRPAVAARSNDFVVVYEHIDSAGDRSIRATFLGPEGEPSKNLELSRVGNNPDVAFEIFENKYVIAYETKNNSGAPCIQIVKLKDAGDEPEFFDLLCPDQNEIEFLQPAVASSPRAVNGTNQTWLTYLEKPRSRDFGEVQLDTPPGYPVDPVLPDRTNDEAFAGVEPRVGVESNDLVALVWQGTFEGMEEQIIARVFDPKDADRDGVNGDQDESGMTNIHIGAGRDPDIAYDLVANRFFVVWNETCPSDDPSCEMSSSIKATTLTADLSGDVGSAITIDSGDLMAVRNPRIDCHNARCSVVWQRGNDGLESSIVARLFSTQGTGLDEEFQVNFDNDEEKRIPALVFAPRRDTSNSTDRLLVAWANGSEADSEIRSVVVPINALVLESDTLDRTFEVNINWKMEELPEEDPARRIPVRPPGLNNVGYFWFYNSQSIEVMVKLQDSGGTPQITYASLTDRPFEVVIRECNTDLDCSESIPLVIPSADPETSQCGGVLEVTEPFTGLNKLGVDMNTCQSDAKTHCLLGRFAVQVDSISPQGDVLGEVDTFGNVLDTTVDGTSLPGDTDVASAAFGTPAPPFNPEVAVKMVRDKDRYWIYYGVATNEQYRIKIRDTACTVGDCAPFGFYTMEPNCGGSLLGVRIQDDGTVSDFPHAITVPYPTYSATKFP